MTDTDLNLEFHDAPPPTGAGRPLDPLMVKFLEVLKANPGKWARFPKPTTTSTASLKKLGYHATSRGPKGAKDKARDLWVCWPATPTSAAKTPPPPPPAKTAEPVKPATPAGRPEGGKVLACNDCDWSTGPTKVGALRTHTLETHGRAPLAVERTPIAAAA
jgi:hypothetical protein